MKNNPFDELKRYVGFNQRDAANLRSLAEPAAPLLSRVWNRFYEVILAHPETQAMLPDEEQVDRLKTTLGEWLRGLFCGTYEDDYFESRSRIGWMHVSVGLPQRYMPLAMDVVRTELSRCLRAAGIDDVEEKIESLLKLLTLDLTIMLSSYQERNTEQIRDFERKDLEEKLAQAQHLAEIGELAASLAHEIKNPLAGISGAIQVIGDSLADDSPYQSVVRDILGQISRLDATVKDLLQYARPTPPERRNIRLREFVMRLLGLLRDEPALRNVHVQFDNTDAVAYADERQLEQLMTNLLLNAAHASKNGAQITVEAVSHAEGLTLIVRDTGIGMPEETRRKALVPFFTTKAKGTGLGLAICRHIAVSHGGSIVLESEPDRGTTVTVELPREPTAWP